MVPSVPWWCIRLSSRILNRHAVPDALLLHCDPVQPSNLPLPLGRHPQIGGRKLFGRGGCPRDRRIGRYRQSILSNQAECLARRAHALVLPLKLRLLPLSCAPLVELPGAVDGPVAESAKAGEAEWSWRERMREMVAN